MTRDQARIDADFPIPTMDRWVGPHSREVAIDFETLYLRRRAASSTAEATATMLADYGVSVGLDAAGRVVITGE